MRVAAGQFQEPLFDPGIADDFAIVENMTDSNFAFSQGTPDEKTAVTIKRIVLGTHERDAIFPGALDNTIQPYAELLGRCHRVVVGDAVAVEPALGRPPAQLLAEKDVSNPLQPECVMQRVAVEVRMASRVGRRANIGNGCDAR